ncbi:hypothetical protein AGMMS50229_08570 [Campylobacterota bacterium]|nr:hypothetical protein AGMMS50229_08570 [Campylobacterota bacterium]
MVSWALEYSAKSVLNALIDYMHIVFANKDTKGTTGLMYRALRHTSSSYSQ